MKKINFKKMYAENFMCFGSDGVSIDFSNFNNIVLIRGKNLDTVENTSITEKHSSNGAGKSSIPAILVYGLYGKTIRKPNKINHKDIINQSVGKKLKVEIYWEITLVYEFRPDMLAYDLYADSRLWWVFAQRNPNTLKDPYFDFVAGVSIYLPKADLLKQLLGL